MLSCDLFFVIWGQGGGAHKSNLARRIMNIEWRIHKYLVKSIWKHDCFLTFYTVNHVCRGKRDGIKESGCFREKLNPSWAQIMQRIMVSYPDHGSGYKKQVPSEPQDSTKKLFIYPWWRPRLYFAPRQLGDKFPNSHKVRETEVTASCHRHEAENENWDGVFV